MRRRDLHRGDGTVGRGRRGGGRRGRAALVAVHAEAVTDAAGSFRFEDLPTGEYELSVWRRSGVVTTRARPGDPAVQLQLN